MSEQLTFLPESSELQEAPNMPQEPQNSHDPWKVLVVDDDPEVHHITRLVLKDLTFSGRSVLMLSAHSTREARDIFSTVGDLAVAWIDVVMETDHAGLDLVTHIREELGIRALRILLRTGHPGQAPEREVIIRYDINDYRSKSDLTASKLLTSTVGALRAFAAISSLQNAERQLQEDKALLERRVNERTRELAASEAHYRAVLRGSPEGVMTLDASGIIMTVNTQAERTFGKDRDTLIGIPFPELLTQACRKSAYGHLQNLAAQRLIDGTIVPREAEALRGDGAPFPLEYSVSPLRFEETTEFVVILRDVTERRQYQETLREAARKATQASQSKSAFLATMSHEIRTPLNGVLGMTQLLSDTALSEEQRDCVHTIYQSGKLLLTLLNNVLDHSTVEAGQLQYDMRPFDPTQCLRDVKHLMEPVARNKGLSLDLKIIYQDDVSDKTACVLGDRDRLRQAVLNLTSNAIKFTEHGGVELRLMLDRADGETHRLQLLCEIEDTGIGIPPERQQDIFREFSQVDASIARRYGGTGLGLSISRGLIEGMGGTMNVRSVPGRGSTFWFSLPLQAADGEHALPIEPVLCDNRHEQEPRVLIIDDNEVNRAIMTSVLGHNGYKVTAAASHTASCKLAARERFDLIFTVLGAPGDVNALRQGPNATANVIALVTDRDPETCQRLSDAGVGDVLVKPFPLAQLIEVADRSHRRDAWTTLWTKAPKTTALNETVAAVGS